MSSLSVCQSASQSVNQPVHLSIRLSICKSDRPSVTHLSVCQSVCPSVNQTAHLSLSLSICQSVCPSVTQSVQLSISLSLCKSVCLSLSLSPSLSVNQSVCQSDCISVNQTVHLSLSLSICHSARPSVNQWSVPRFPGESGVGKTAITDSLLRKLSQEGGCSYRKNTVFSDVFHFADKNRALLDNISSMSQTSPSSGKIRVVSASAIPESVFRHRYRSAVPPI